MSVFAGDWATSLSELDVASIDRCACRIAKTLTSAMGSDLRTGPDDLPLDFWQDIELLLDRFLQVQCPEWVESDYSLDGLNPLVARLAADGAVEVFGFVYPVVGLAELMPMWLRLTVEDGTLTGFSAKVGEADDNTGQVRTVTRGSRAATRTEAFLADEAEQMAWGFEVSSS